MIDWSWFFSSLAQSAAAIVGLFGAFIVTKVLSNEAVFSQKKAKLADLMARSARLVDDAEALSFEWYNKRTAEDELETLKERWEKEQLPNADSLYEQMEFSIFMPRKEAIELIRASIKRWTHVQEQKEEAQRKRRELQRMNPLAAALQPPDFEMHSVGLHRHLLNPSLSTNLAKERDAIDLVLRNVRDHIRHLRAFIADIETNPESSPHITYALIAVTVLFYVGVIYPLSFMPTGQGQAIALSANAFVDILFSLRGALLTATSLVFTFLLGMFLVFNARMKYDPASVVALRNYLNLGSYSEYFGVMEENEAPNSRGDAG